MIVIRMWEGNMEGMRDDCLKYLVWFGYEKEEALRMTRNASEGFIRQCAEAWREHCRKAFEED